MNRLRKVLCSDFFKIVISSILFVVAMIFEHFGFEYPSLGLYVPALIIAGGEVFYEAVRGIIRRDLLDEKFLMSIASVGAMIIGEWSEGVAVMLFFLIGEAFEHYAVKRSRSSIRSLMDICPDEANLLTDVGVECVDAEDVEVGSLILIRPGERVPIDSVIVKGSCDVDTSSMSGEPLPVSMGEGDTLYSGYIVKNGLITAKTVKMSTESAAARILSLVEFANENKSEDEKFITKFSRVYTPAVVIAAILVAVLTPLFGLYNFTESVYVAFTFLVISCPCALVISVPLAFFGGIGGAASRGILFKGGNVFSKLAKVDSCVFDKTGTLTSGKFSVSRTECFGVNEEELMMLTASVESASNHPLAECLGGIAEDKANVSCATEYAGEGIVGELDGGDTVAVGNLKLMNRLGVDTSFTMEMSSGVFVSKNGKLIGLIELSDEVKAESRETVEALRKLGVKRSYILSGDREDNVKRVKESCGIDVSFSSMSPNEKYSKLEEIIGNSSSTMYVGDGINDAPSIARADVGVAMGSVGQDSAIEASDVVIMTDNLSKIPEAIKISRKTISISKQNIIFALISKFMILILSLFGMANMWLAVFADVGVAVIAILNSMRALRIGKGNRS